ncbi:hypothetical protein PR202_ga30547 [Eleusine coracana subsp. coracana]|uniref:ABC transporter domain-containing protein n=1 Tax=Eleusine coracana subsp. coracana TaxID=191504 RepID=A0AAV5DPY8_ELECO|nr:hypothetical protein PR202_ga30513 [Eleusine coracana subsp. coracana]GJN12281.1 hypothetical protein PR202_ga30547 [Eleusine coracana subsp. coracana]
MILAAASGAVLHLAGPPPPPSSTMAAAREEAADQAGPVAWGCTAHEECQVADPSMAASPLPRWAPTPSPRRPLRASTTGQTFVSSWSTWAWCDSFGIFTSRSQSTPPPTGSPPGDAVEAGCDEHTQYNHNARALDGVDAGNHHEDEVRRMVFLTWEDLSVTAFGNKGSHAMILDGLTGYARPGEVLALMGPSGCGKTTLLDTLAGRLGHNMKATGDILINGRREKLAFGTSVRLSTPFLRHDMTNIKTFGDSPQLIILTVLKAYVTQDDLLMATLTVTEAVRYSAQLQLPDTVPPAEKRARADRAILQMGLAAVADKRIGGRVCKGISGGQRRRVSICIELLASPALVFLDEPTSGLDSAAAFHVMSRITRLARTEKMTVVAAMHQPSNEVRAL